MALIVGCSSDGDIAGNNSSSSSLLSGLFLDSPVEGLEFETETQFGVTDADGTFMYMSGETIFFHVGDIILGEAIAQAMMTPLDLVEGAVDETHPMVTNMARFLQTMDEDMDPENGITITQKMAEAMVGHMIDFDMDVYDFEYDPSMVAVMDTINMVDSSGMLRMMVSIEDAQSHLASTMDGMSPDGSGMMDGEDMTGNNGGMTQH